MYSSQCTVQCTMYNIHCRLWQEWQDVNMKWNKSEYGEIVDIRIPPKYIWKPDLLMYNRWGGSSVLHCTDISDIVMANASVGPTILT